MTYLLEKPLALDQSKISQGVSDTIANATRDPDAETPQARKLRKSAQEFEALLISSWWREMQQSSLDSEDSDSVLGAGADTLQGLGMNAMATAVAQGGGLGIARMLVHSLEPSLHGSASGAGATGVEHAQTPEDGSRSGFRLIKLSPGRAAGFKVGGPSKGASPMPPFAVVNREETTPHPPSFLGHPLPKGEGRKIDPARPLPGGEGGERK